MARKTPKKGDKVAEHDVLDVADNCVHDKDLSLMHHPENTHAPYVVCEMIFDDKGNVMGFKRGKNYKTKKEAQADYDTRPAKLKAEALKNIDDGLARLTAKHKKLVDSTARAMLQTDIDNGLAERSKIMKARG